MNLLEFLNLTFDKRRCCKWAPNVKFIPLEVVGSAANVLIVEPGAWRETVAGPDNLKSGSCRPGQEAHIAVVMTTTITNGSLFSYFGYGSLVNRHTLRTDYVTSVPARLEGWRRVWQSRAQSADYPVSLLSVRPVKESSIDGVVVVDRLSEMPALDRREEGYDRKRLPDHAVERLRDQPHEPSSLYVYVAADNGEGAPRQPILRSYLDAVMQGFLANFGEEGVHRFVATTDGFDRDILEDRVEPRYARAVMLTATERGLFDQILKMR